MVSVLVPLLGNIILGIDDSIAANRKTVPRAPLCFILKSLLLDYYFNITFFFLLAFDNVSREQKMTQQLGSLSHSWLEMQGIKNNC